MMRCDLRQGATGLVRGVALALGLMLGLALLMAAPALCAGNLSPEEMLRRFQGHAAGIRTLQVAFTQHKYLALLDDTLISRGLLCVRHSPEGATLLWEYAEPEISGFFMNNDGLQVWLRSRAARREASREERMALGGLSAQVLAWIRADADQLLRTYRVGSASPDARPHGADPGLRFVPLREGLFSAIEVRFSPDLTRLSSLRLVEAGGGDDTLLLFESEQRNEPLGAVCLP